jgi:hypothetical protein
MGQDNFFSKQSNHNKSIACASHALADITAKGRLVIDPEFVKHCLL